MVERERVRLRRCLKARRSCFFFAARAEFVERIFLAWLRRDLSSIFESAGRGGSGESVGVGDGSAVSEVSSDSEANLTMFLYLRPARRSFLAF